MATKTQVSKFIKQIAPMAVAQYKAGKKILPSVCIAQACCESAYGTSPKMIRANAVFGVKVGKSKYHFGKAWKDQAYSTKTKECYDGKTYTNIVDLFRAYATIEDAVTDYYDMLCACSRYRKAVNARTALDTITAIKDGGYATSPTYINTIMTIIRSNNLTVYDDMAANKELYYAVPRVQTNSIATALICISEDGSFTNRKRIAVKNGIKNYQGTSSENLKLLGLLMDGKLLKV